MRIDSGFKPAWWLTNAHAQTMFSTLSRRIQAPIDHIERFELPDGDFVDLAWAINGLSSDAPLVIMLHGLGGSASSTYVAGQMHSYNRQGWRAVLMQFRGAGQEPNRLPRAYHSGETADFDCFLKALAKREPHTKKAAVGISLGGNVLLKWLGESGEQSLIDAAVAVSVPFSLNQVADKINRGFSRCYQRYLLKRLYAMFDKKREKYPTLLPDNMADMRSLRCFWTFDEHVTAPLFGFPHVHAYYRESSSRQYLSRIKTPTLIIHSLDDPFMTASVIPDISELSNDITLELTKRGGHVGFISGKIAGRPIYWLEQRIPEYLMGFFE